MFLILAKLYFYRSFNLSHHSGDIMLNRSGYFAFSRFLLCYEGSNAGLINSNTSQNSRLRITNQCANILWIQQDYKHQINDPVVVEIPSGKSYDYTIPDAGLASTRFWPKSGCGNGNLCAQLTIDNTGRTNTFPATVSNMQLQFNMNTSVGITAYLNDKLLTNASPIPAADYSLNSVLKAYQANKQATCDLILNPTSVQRGTGEFCNRLNIVPEIGNKVHIYLPADIPDMAGSVPPPIPPAQTAKYVVLGMDADFKSNIVTNGSKVAPDTLNNNTLTWPSIEYCQGVVVNGDIIHFPVFSGFLGVFLIRADQGELVIVDMNMIRD